MQDGCILSLWLVPTPSSTAAATYLVNLASEAAHTEPFPPHVTLLTLAAGTSAAVAAAVAERLALATQPLQLAISSVEAGLDDRHWKYRCVYLRVQHSSSLARLRAAAVATLPAIDAKEEYMPHLSLCYSDCAAAERILLRDAVAASASVPDDITLARLELRDCTSASTADWCVLGTWPLGRLSEAAVHWHGQEYTWDCGLACLVSASAAAGLPLAATPTARAELAEAFRAPYLRSAAAASAAGLPFFLWSSDVLLAALDVGLRPRLHSASLGLPPSHAHSPFYAAAVGNGAGVAIAANLAAAVARGARVREWPSGVPAAALRRAAAAGSALIVLVDKSRLACVRCGGSEAVAAAAAATVAPAFEAADGAAEGRAYIGHYVLLHPDAWAREGEVEYSDPARRPHADGRACAVTVAAFEIARTAPGTDEDILCLPLVAVAAGDDRRGDEDNACADLL